MLSGMLEYVGGVGVGEVEWMKVRMKVRKIVLIDGRIEGGFGKGGLI